MATIRDIAEHLGISISTVSKGLNGGTDISEELRSRILDTAVEMGYQTKQSKKTGNRKLAVFIENMAYEKPSDFGYDIVLGFRQTAAREKWNVEIIPSAPEKEKIEKYDAYLLKNGFSGAFLVGFAMDDPWLEQLKTTRMPTVLLDNEIPYNSFVCEVGTDSREGIGLAVDHLRKLGHTKIAFLNGSQGSRVTYDRQEAFERNMKRVGLLADEKLMAYGYFVPEAASYHVRGFLEHGATAILCASDLIAEGVIAECARMGYRVPEDVSVIGYDDIALAAALDPPLTTVRQERKLLGSQAYMSLYSLIHGIPVGKTLLRPALILRQSCGAVR